MPDKRLRRPTINGKRSKVWYIVWSEKGRSQRYSTGQTDKIEAERVLARFEKVEPPESFDISQLCEAYVQARIKAGRSEDNLRNSLTAPLARFSRDTPKTLTQSKIRDYIAERQKTVKNSTIVRDLRTLQAALNWGVQENWMEYAPVIKAPPAGGARRRFLTRDEFKRLEGSTDTLHLKTFLSLAINTASRAAKILSLTWSQIDFDRNIVWYEQGTHANKRTQPVPINKTLLADLRLAEQFAVSEYVVEFNGKQVKSVRKAFERAVARAELEDVVIHDLRRTAASWALMAGASFDDIAALLNDDVKIVQKHYAQFSPSHIRGVVDRLG